MIILKGSTKESALLKFLKRVQRQFNFTIEIGYSCENNEDPEFDELKIAHDELIETNTRLAEENAALTNSNSDLSELNTLLNTEVVELKSANLEIDDTLGSYENKIKEKDLQIKDLTKENKKLKKAE